MLCRCAQAGGREQTKPLRCCAGAGTSQAGTNLTEPQIDGLSDPDIIACGGQSCQFIETSQAIHFTIYPVMAKGPYIAHVGHSAQPQHC